MKRVNPPIYLRTDSAQTETSFYQRWIIAPTIEELKLIMQAVKLFIH